MEVVAMLFTYPTNCHMLRFNSNRPFSGPPSIDEEIFLTSILAEFLENVKLNHGSRSYVVYLSNELSHAKIQFKSATFWASLN
jgi:hypothetical protein